MLRAICVLFLLVVVASCGSKSSGPAPSKLDNACSILRERPEYRGAFRTAERRWGVPMHVQMATIHQESKFDPKARTPFRYVLSVIPMGRQSSAYGFSQALDGTWEEYQRKQRRFGARRDNINDAADFIGWYMSQSNRELGIRMNDTRNQYLAYHEGRTGYKRQTYRSKAWLIAVADKVQARGQTYQRQLQRCA